MFAGIVALPAESPHTSIRERVEHVKATGRMADAPEIRDGSDATKAVVDELERDCGWSRSQIVVSR